jgi:hypothetical protein
LRSAGIAAGLRSLIRGLADKTKNAEVSPAGREVGVGNLTNTLERHVSIIGKSPRHPPPTE